MNIKEFVRKSQTEKKIKAEERMNRLVIKGRLVKLEKKAKKKKVDYGKNKNDDNNDNNDLITYV